MAAIGPLPDSTFVSGIDSIAPPTACAGSVVTIHGSGFGSTQQPHIVVVIGAAPVEVVSWSDTAIEIRIPNNFTSGCVGFRDENAESERRALHRRNQDRLRDLAAGLRCLGTGVALPNVPYSPAAPECTGTNHFTAPLPVIDYFLVNGRPHLTVTPGTDLTLTWQLSNATEVRLRRTSVAGPAIDELNPAGNARALGPFEGDRPVGAVYELVATNPCGTVRRNVSVLLRSRPNLSILGVEVIQSIQRFDLANPAQNNSVRLVARKRTLARVYVDSGIRDGFNYTGASDGQNLLEVTGELTVIPAAGGQGTSAGRPINRDPAGPDGVVRAGPARNILRGGLHYTLNFDLPLNQLVGDVRLDVRVWATGGGAQFGGFGGWQASDSGTVVKFHPVRDVNLVRVLVKDNKKGVGPPSAADYGNDVWEALTRFPISDFGLNFFVLPGKDPLETDYDYTQRTSWSELMDDLVDLADCVDDDGRNLIWTALLPRESLPENATELGLIFGMGDDVPPPPHCASVVGGDLFAHELGHTFAVDHAPCGLPANETPDPRLPADTEDIGMHMQASPVRLVNAGTKEIESYCRSSAKQQDTKWSSIALWDIIFDQLALDVASGP
jgi:hypothetical protein